MKHIFSLLLVLTIVFSFFSCAPKTDVNTGHLTVNGTETTPAWVVKIDGNEISFAEYRHFYLNGKLDLAGNDNDYFTENPQAADILKETVLDCLKERYAILKIAKDMQIALNSDEEKDIQEEIKNTKAELGAEGYAASLSDYYLTEELFADSLRHNALYSKTYETLIAENGALHVSEDELKAYIEQNYYCYAQIYIDFRTGEGTNMHEATDKLLDTVVTRLENGDDFYAVAFSHSDDQTIMDYRNGYLIAKDTLSEEKSVVLSALNTNDISDPLLTGEGYFIFMKMPVSAEVIEENREFLLHGYTDLNGVHTNGLYENRFYEMIVDATKNFSVEYADCYDAIAPDTVF